MTMMKKSNIIGYALLLLTFASIIEGYIIPNPYKRNSISGAKRNNLKLRNNNNPVCNEKYIYMNYLLGLRNFKRVYRIIKDTSNIDMQNIINILSNINITQIADITANDTTTGNNGDNNPNSIFINNTNNDNNKIVKNIVVSNIYIDVSNVKYIQISTRNDTLLVELDKNNVEASAATSNNMNNIMYDITKIETLVSSISLIMKVLNIN
jgi:hypothetical protein